MLVCWVGLKDERGRLGVHAAHYGTVVQMRDARALLGAAGRFLAANSSRGMKAISRRSREQHRYQSRKPSQAEGAPQHHHCRRHRRQYRRARRTEFGFDSRATCCQNVACGRTMMVSNRPPTLARPSGTRINAVGSATLPKWQQMLDRFGLNPSARTRVLSLNDEATDEFEDFVAKKTG